MESLRKRGLERGFWTLADQGTVSLGNFLTQVILARNLPRVEYGVFALLFGVLFILFTCHMSLITYPLSVRGAAADQLDLRRLTTGSLFLTAILNVPLTAAALGATLVLKRLDLAPWVVAALVFWLLQETVRRAFMAHLRHREAIWGDGIGYLGQAALLWALAHGGHLSLPRAFAVMALTSGIAGVVQAAHLGLATVRFHDLQSLFPTFWRMGRWAFLAHTTDSATTQAFPWALGLFYGPQEAAPFQAILNVLGASHPIIFSSANLIVPAAAKAYREGGMNGASRSAFKYGTLGVALLLPYYGLLMIAPHAAVGIVYGKASVYLHYETALRTLVAAYLSGYLFLIIAGLLNGVERSHSVFLAELGGAGAALVFGIPLTLRFGVLGASAGFLSVTLTRAAVAGFLVRKLPGLGNTDKAWNGEVPLVQEVEAADGTEPFAGGVRSLSTKPLSLPSEPET